MSALEAHLRNTLERTIIEARDVATTGANAALEALAVHHHEAYPHQKSEQRKLRSTLRAHAKQLGDPKNDKGGFESIDHLVHECAYEHWHRMLFARFLAENDFLIEPDSGMAISLAEAEELAKSAKVDLWTYASRCAQQMLPQIFRPGDPLLQVSLANEHRVKLERLLGGLDSATFKADDSLGWVYQFWQSAEKERVNTSGEKITGDTLPAVTQLFTEHYMVLFLLHNTLGAWHAGKVLAGNPTLAELAASEEEVRKAVALQTPGGYEFEYLRFVRGADGSSGHWRPAAGIFDSWPKTAAELMLLDPCCGSGHFLVAGFELLVRLRMEEEGLIVSEAVGAVLRQNIHGLELDARCTQIAAFNLAMAAWRIARHQPLPAPNIACVGIGPQATRSQWVDMADGSTASPISVGRDLIRNGLLKLHDLFSKAPTLGSLIDPTGITGDLISADFETLRPYLNSALASEASDDETKEHVFAAQGMVKAADLLGRKYTLVITNVPYLGRIRQNEDLRAYCQEHYPEAKLDLGACFIERCNQFCARGGTTAIVIPQNILFLASYKKLRNSLLSDVTWHVAARLGAKGFRTPMWDFGVALLALTPRTPSVDSTFVGIDVGDAPGPEAKSKFLALRLLATAVQSRQLGNPDAAITFEEASETDLLLKYASSVQGASTVDIERFCLFFWEILLNDNWNLHQSTPAGGTEFSGLEFVSIHRRPGGDFEKLAEDLKAEGRLGGAWSGQPVWGKSGIASSWMGTLPVALYLGAVYDNSIAAIIPENPKHLPAIWCFCSSPEYLKEVRKINQKTQVANATLVKVPFDLEHWQSVASAKYPKGLPEPESDDPTQWIFHGCPKESASPVQVAVARLLGYRWPAEVDTKMRLSQRARQLVENCRDLESLTDRDGIVCIPSVRGEEPAVDRLIALLSACDIEPDPNVDDYLRNEFFQEHNELFHQRPFIWHVWDGRKRDGFHALLNYHKLVEGEGRGKKLLESLTYSYLGDWINRQQDGVKRGLEGAEDRLAAATELQKRLIGIVEGEPPFDLFVRWKPLDQQAIGWEPDINDGIRVNIRPFMASDIPGGRGGAGILRWKPKIDWDKDRGKEPHRDKRQFPWFYGWTEGSVDFLGNGEFSGDRFTDCHYTLSAKRKARESSGAYATAGGT